MANAQYDWLQSPIALKAGWKALQGDNRYNLAQQYANQGKIVIAIYQNADRTKPGHIALIMPRERSPKVLEDQGPEVIMAGTHNQNYISLRNGFASHITAWPENDIRLFVQDKMPVLEN